MFSEAHPGSIRYRWRTQLVCGDWTQDFRDRPRDRGVGEKKPVMGAWFLDWATNTGLRRWSSLIRLPGVEGRIYRRTVICGKGW